MPTVEERFWSKVDKTGDCWIWLGGVSGDGYGRFWDGPEKMIGAHRFSWLLAGESIPEGEYVCHHCDNPPCVRPSHLFVGTQQDNIDDKMRKGRHVASKGSDNGMSLLSEEDVRNICGEFNRGTNQNKIARQYGISKKHISDIIRGKRWGYLGLGLNVSHYANGEKSGRARLTENNVLQIRTTHKNGCSRKDLMKEFGISSSTLHYILSGRTWVHLGE